METRTKSPETQRIVNYLQKKGKMSGVDICRDNNIDIVDVLFAEHDGAIVQVSPEPGGSGPWFNLPN